MLSVVEYFHVSSRFTDCIAMEGVRLLVLSEGAGARAERPEAEGTKGAERETRIRGNFHDGSEGLGWRVDIWPDDHWKDPGELAEVDVPRKIAILKLIIIFSYAFFIFSSFNDRCNNRGDD